MANTLTEIYVDGSYKDNCVSYAFIILQNKKIVKVHAGKVPDESLTKHRQIAGELYALGYALRWCEQNQITHVTVYYDYEGIEAWATGRWKAKTPLTQRYQAFMQKIPTQIHWQKVKSHSGNFWNQKVDKLAKLACNPYPLLQSFVEFLKIHLQPAQIKVKTLPKNASSCSLLYYPPSNTTPETIILEVSFPKLSVSAPSSFPQNEKERIEKLWELFLKKSRFWEE